MDDNPIKVIKRTDTTNGVWRNPADVVLLSDNAITALYAGDLILINLNREYDVILERAKRGQGDDQRD